MPAKWPLFLDFANSRLPLKKYPLFRVNGYERGIRLGREWRGRGDELNHGSLFNSLWPNDAIWSHKSGSMWYQIIDCRLFGQAICETNSVILSPEPLRNKLKCNMNRTVTIFMQYAWPKWKELNFGSHFSIAFYSHEILWRAPICVLSLHVPD